MPKFPCAMLSFVFLVVWTTGCDSQTVRCGMGTVERDGVCIRIDERMDVGDAPDASIAVDATPDGAAPDTGAPDTSLRDVPVQDVAPVECEDGDISLCDGQVLLECGTGLRTACASFDRCHTYTFSDGSRDSFCSAPGVTPCHISEYEARCEGDLMRACGRSVDVDGRERASRVITEDCGVFGPGGACVEDPTLHCESEACDVETFEPGCGGREYTTRCERGFVRYDACDVGRRCVENRVAKGGVCVPNDAVPSSTGSRVPEVRGCRGDWSIVQWHGYEWAEPCAPTVVPGTGPIPTTCVERDGTFGCLPSPSVRATCAEVGWSCSSSRSRYCDGERLEQYRCGSICNPSTGRCIPPDGCDLTAPRSGICIDATVGVTCLDPRGDGAGWIGGVRCATACAEDPFVCTSE